MTMIRCGECKTKISDQAASCPKCGAPMSVAKKQPKNPGIGSMIFAIGALVVIGIVANSGEDADDMAERQRLQQEQQQRDKEIAEAKNRAVEEFRQNPTPVLAQAASLHQQGKWIEVMQLLKPLLPTKNADAQRLHDDAQEQQWLSVASKIPKSSPKRNLDMYSKLAALRPDNRGYAEKRDHYNRKWGEQQAREAAEKALFGDPPRKLEALNNSYYEVTTHLERTAHDPDSIEIVGCTDVYKNENGWLIGCKYRGKNAFGGKILTAGWFLVRQGRVVQQFDKDDFKW